MADILLTRDSNLAATYIPNTFIDQYMTHADGEFVKIYLYLLRCMESPDVPFSISDIADKFDHTEKDVTRALGYWEKMHLLRLEFNRQEELTGICLTGPVSASGPASPSTPPIPAGATVHMAAGTAAMPTRMDTDAAEAESPAAKQAPERIPYTKDQLLQFDQDETVCELLYVAERYLGRPLNDTEVQTIIYWLDQLGFSQDLIDYLIEQCVAKNHTDIRYMDKIALDWAKEGIHTLAAAKQASQGHSKTAYAVRKAFGICGRNLIDHELAYIRKWSKQQGFTDEIISLACQKTICTIHTASFQYADTILQDWKKQKVCSKKDVELLDAQHQESQAKKYAMSKAAAVRTAKTRTVNARPNGFANFKQRSYDFEKLERELLTR